MSIVAGLGKDLWGLVFPGRCFGCEGALGPGDYGAVCPRCLAAMPRLGSPCCDRCGLPLPGGGICPSCVNAALDFDHARAAVPFEALARDLVHGYKFHGLLRLRGLFVGRMVEAFRTHAEVLGADALGEVPLLRRQARFRGRNHAGELAASLSRELGIPRVKLLCKVRATERQAELPRSRRGDNVRGAFAVRRRRVAASLPASYLLIDDVMTTGSTASACAAALKAAGVGRVSVLTFARTLRADEDP